MRVYISGKIGEYTPSAEVLDKFARAEKMLKAKGYATFNPTTSGFGKMADLLVEKAKAEGVETTWYAEIMKLDIEALSFCNAIYMLEDWEQSNGAKVELSFAMAISIRILWQNLEDAQVYHNDNETAEEVWLP